MASPTLASDFQIGVDNALIQVPQYYTVPANPPAEPNPPDGLSLVTNIAKSTTKDTVTIYVSAIKGFNHTLTMSVFIQRIDLSVDPLLPPSDVTTAPADQLLIGQSHTNMLACVYDPVDNGWKQTFLWFLIPNVSNSLNTYVATNFRTLWINPQGTGGNIDPNHPPSYLVNIYAVDPISNTYAACSFTLVVLPSVVNYGLGVIETIKDKNASLNIGNSVSLQKNNGTSADIYFNFYPFESTSLIPNRAPADVTVSIEYYKSPIIDVGLSTIASPAYGGGVPIAFNVYDNQIVIPKGFDRDSLSTNVIVHLVLNNSADAGSTNPLLNHALFKLTGTDTNGVSISAYTIIRVVT